MDSRIHEILLQNDDSADVDYPAGFDYRRSMAAVVALKPHAERILGQRLRLDDQVQDASFFAELFVFEDGAVGSKGVTALVFKVAMRFSAFGRMATIYTNSAASDLGGYPVTGLAELLGQHGFNYIPVESLGERYDGKLQWLHQSLGGAATWWYRFFDYV